jgi:hypothetical protein
MVVPGVAAFFPMLLSLVQLLLALFYRKGNGKCGKLWEMGKWQTHTSVLSPRRAPASFLTNYNKEVLFA